VAQGNLFPNPLSLVRDAAMLPSYRRGQIPQATTTDEIRALLPWALKAELSPQVAAMKQAA
jgi:hypothetical protein